MKLEQWGLLAEILSAIAVVGSLVFVGLQVRQGAEETALNTRAIQANAYQALTSQISTINQVVIDNPEFALAWQSLLRGEPPQTETENAQVTAYLFMVYRHGELAFIQYQNGLLEESGLRGILGPVFAFAATDTGRRIWDSQIGLNSSYKEYVEGQLAD